MRTPLLFVILVGTIVSGAFAQDLIVVNEVPGGPMKTDLGYGISVNKYSSMNRRWLIVNSGGCPAVLSNAGVQTKYVDNGYEFKGDGSLKSSAALQAFEVRFILYDVWGDYMKTLSGTQVQDIPENTEFDLSLSGSWYARETEVSEFALSVAYIARVRTADGKLWTADPKRVIESLLNSSVPIKLDEMNPSKADNGVK